MSRQTLDTGEFVSTSESPAAPRNFYHGLTGAAILVTGGATGIGAQLVRDFAAQGARVAFLDILSGPGAALAEELCSGGATVKFFNCDVRELKQIASGVDAAAAWAGRLDVLINNAAWDDRHTLGEVTPAYWDESVAVNLRHAFFAAQAAAPFLIASGKGVIINMGSTSWMTANGGYSVYATCKAAMLGLTRSLARELGEAGVRVNCVTPGWVMTDRQKSLWATPEALAANRARQCIKQDLAPHHVSAMAMFLASDAAAGCTAQNFVVDLGQS